MRKLIYLSIIALFAKTTTAQQITGSSLFSPAAGGARILAGQGNTAANPAIGFQSTVSTTALAQNDGGGGNGIFRPLANTMAFSTFSTERMRINSNGNIGIGTSSPSAKLHVLGSQYIQSGALSIGIAAPSNTSHKLHVHDGNLILSGVAAGFGNSGILFSDNVASTAYPNGRWGIEYLNGQGLNFWQPWNPSTGGGSNFYLLLKDNGKIGMGLDPASCANAFGGSYRLYVKDGILTEKVKVAVACSAQWADYVFDKDYKLISLSEVEQFIQKNKHLPGIPSANKLVVDGLDLGEMQAKQMQKIEELTLYIIELQKQIDALKK